MIWAAGITFLVTLIIGMVAASKYPALWVWLWAEYAWVSIATLTVFTAIPDAAMIDQEFSHNTRRHDVELDRYLSRRVAESAIRNYSERLRDPHITDLARNTFQDGILWFESAARSLNNVHSSNDWQVYLPDSPEFQDFKVPDPNPSGSHVIAQDKLRLSEFVSGIRTSFEALNNFEARFDYGRLLSILIGAMPFMLAFAGAIELAAISAKHRVLRSRLIESDK